MTDTKMGEYKKAREYLEEERDAYREALEWYANWDWSDKYVEPVPKMANKVLERYGEGR